MSVEVSKSLATFFKQKTGQSLRFVGHYTADSIDIVYLRDDLTDEYDESTFRETFEIHRQDKAAATRQQSVIEAGNHHCTLRVYDEAIVFNFAQTDDIGTIVSVTPDVGRNLLTFVTQCLEEIHEGSSQQVTVPEWVTA